MNRALRLMTLFAQTQPSDDLQIPVAIFAGQVFKQLVSLADHLEQPATRGVILFVRLEVLGQLVDALGQNRDLHFGTAGVGIVRAISVDDGLFLLSG